MFTLKSEAHTASRGRKDSGTYTAVCIKRENGQAYTYNTSVLYAQYYNIMLCQSSDMY